jgi:hypothetical protein
MSDASVHLTMSGRMTFEDDITLAQAAQVLAILTGQPPGSVVGQRDGVLDLRSDTSTTPIGSPMAPAPAPAPQQPPSPEPAPSPREILQQTGAKTNAEKIVAFAGYLTRTESTDTFTVQDVRQVFRRAREPLPGNLNRDVDSAIRSGLIIPGDTRGEYQLTARADEVLAAGFTPHRSPGRSPARRIATRATPPTELADLEELPAGPEHAPAFHDLPLKRDKVLWVLAAAKGAGVDGLSNQGIEWLTDQYGDGVRSKHVGVHYDALQRAGFVHRSFRDQTIRITPQGEAYLRRQRAAD